MTTGIDIVKISRIEKLLKNGIPKKVFSLRESEYINSKKFKARTAAGLFAAKEAVVKALGCGITVPLDCVEILHNPKGQPYVMLSGKVLAISREMGIECFAVSISHDGEYAVASANAKTDGTYLSYIKIIDKFKTAPDNAITPHIAENLLPHRKNATHKGSYGRLYALAGSKGLTGAAIMACTAALRCGAGLISLGCADELNTIFEIAMQEIMTKPLKSKNGVISAESTQAILKEISSADVCLIGPGLGRNQDITSIMESVLSSSLIPMVIDADGLYAISENINMLSKHKNPIIITPHIGEFSRLTGLSAEEILSDTPKYAVEFSKKHNVITVLKSHRTVVSSPEGRVYVNILGNPGMATGGSGDVLSGAIASFMAQGMSAFDSALAGVYIHSLAADMGADFTGEYSLTPSDIISYIPHAIKQSQKR